MTSSSRSQTTLILMLGGLVLLIGLIILSRQQFQSGEGQVACTLEAKLCPDGSAVGRTGPRCEFAKCPGEN